MSLRYCVNKSNQLVLKVNDYGFRHTLRFDVFDRDFLSMAKRWITKDGSPELVISSSSGMNFVISTDHLADVGVVACDHIKRLLIEYLSELLGWDHIVLKVGVGPYDKRCSPKIKVCDVYDGNLGVMKDYTKYRYFPPGTIFATVRKRKKVVALRCHEVVVSDSRHVLEEIAFAETLDAIDWHNVVPVLKERVNRQRRLATY